MLPKLIVAILSDLKWYVVLESDRYVWDVRAAEPIAGPFETEREAELHLLAHVADRVDQRRSAAATGR